MTAEQQIERSVLESKEREELHAIAQAMALKTTSRTKKADIIDQILEATGVGGGAVDVANGSVNGSDANGSRALGATIADDTDETDDTDDSPSSNGERDGTDAGRSVAAQSVSATTDTGPARDPSGQRSAQRHSPSSPEPGNRRGRRRRGRERPGDRDLQGASQDGAYQGDLVEIRGLLDLRDEGYGFLRCDGFLPSSKDVYVSISQARRFALRKGDYIEGACRPASNNEKYPALLRIDSVSGLDSEGARNRPRFEDLTPLFPDSKLPLELPGEKDNVTARIVDLISPIGKGQRGMIVSPPKAGKTTIMKQIAHSIEANNPEVHLMVLLVDERPEEVTDMRRSVKGEVVASTFDRPSDEHTAVAELAIERAKRLVELGKDVVIILDGITRLARAYNLAAPATGRIMSGGVDSGALYPPKKFFGAARNIEEGGSLTILATALVETGSKMDEVIFEEFKGTGNMELRLDRRLAERRLYPSIDVNASSTRHEELLFDRGQLQQVWKLRRVLNALANEGSAAAGLELLMDKIRTTTSNDEFLAEIAKGPNPGN
jgi:transcription termination factor Rho